MAFSCQYLREKLLFAIRNYYICWISLFSNVDEPTAIDRHYTSHHNMLLNIIGQCFVCDDIHMGSK